MVGNETTTTERELEDIAALEAPDFADGNEPVIEPPVADTQEAYERIWEKFELDRFEQQRAEEARQRAEEAETIATGLATGEIQLMSELGSNNLEIASAAMKLTYIVELDGTVKYLDQNNQLHALETNSGLSLQAMETEVDLRGKEYGGSVKAHLRSYIDEFGRTVHEFVQQTYRPVNQEAAENFFSSEGGGIPDAPLEPIIQRNDQSEPSAAAKQPPSLDILTTLTNKGEPLHEFQSVPEAPFIPEINHVTPTKCNMANENVHNITENYQSEAIGPINAPDPFLVEMLSPPPADERSKPVEKITPAELTSSHFSPLVIHGVRGSISVIEAKQYPLSASLKPVVQTNETQQNGEGYHPPLTESTTNQLNHEPRPNIPAAENEKSEFLPPAQHISEKPSEPREFMNDPIKPETRQPQKTIQELPISETFITEQAREENIFFHQQVEISQPDTLTVPLGIQPIIEETRTAPTIAKTNSYLTLESPYLTTSSEIIVAAVETHLQPVATIQLEAGSSNKVEPFLAMVEPALQREIIAAISSVQASDPAKVVISPRPGELALDSALVVSGNSEKITLELFVAPETTELAIAETTVQTEDAAEVVIESNSLKDTNEPLVISLSFAESSTDKKESPPKNENYKADGEIAPEELAVERAKHGNQRTQIPFSTFPANLGVSPPQRAAAQQTANV